MASSNVCPKCGFANQPGYQFCTNCGATIAAGAAAGMPPPAGPPPGAYAPPYPAYAPPWEYERRKQIDRTKTGLLLLLVGAILSWIPLISAVGALVAFIGAILVILGRKPFGAKHSRNVIVSLVMYIVGIIAYIVFVIAAVLASLGNYLGTPTDPAALVAAAESAINSALLGSIVLAVALGIANILFIIELQNPMGRIVLFAAFGASVAISVATYFVVSPLLATAFAGLTDPNEIAAAAASLEAQIATIGYLGVISAALYAVADYIAWSRINRGEIPAPPAQPPAPGMAPPAPPVQPR